MTVTFTAYLLVRLQLERSGMNVMGLGIYSESHPTNSNIGREFYAQITYAQSTLSYADATEKLKVVIRRHYPGLMRYIRD